MNGMQRPMTSSNTPAISTDSFFSRYLSGPLRFILFVLSLALTSRIDDAAGQIDRDRRRKARRDRARARARAHSLNSGRPKGQDTESGSVFDAILKGAHASSQTTYTDGSASESEGSSINTANGAIRVLHSFQRKIGRAEIVRAWQLEGLIAEWCFRAVQLGFLVFLVVAGYRWWQGCACSRPVTA
ncbi:hypothetical protein PYCC9005_004885 [Savitreella phatthalungensis]